MSKIRLQVFLSRNGICSRREALSIVQSGLVMVNGKVVSEPSFPVDPETDQIRYRGKIVGPKPSEYVMLHKPSGYVTTKEDAFARKKVIDLLPPSLQHLNPVGRLDKETEGLLLLTNDGALLQRLTHPKFDVGKEYFVRVKGCLEPHEQKQLEKGVTIEGKKTSPAQISNLQCDGRVTDFHIVIHEGWNRQIRKMCDSLGHEVRYLKRLRHGPVKLGNMPKGSWRRLTKIEIENLKKEHKNT
ncbi:MAG: pseudouridine synthase [Candidatus Omnitrophota bacterium]